MGREENVYVSLGSNSGDRRVNLELAGRELAGLESTEVTGCSTARLTAPVGLADQPEFLNQVQRLATLLRPEELLERLQVIENKLGRIRAVRWGPRIIDLDILFYGNLSCRTPILQLPHPELWNRPFFLEMISEIDSGFLKGREHPGRSNESGGNSSDADGGN